MTMQFREIKDSIINILGAASAGRYQTVGFQRQKKSADEVVDNNRMVQVYYASGEFPKSAGRNTGPTQHDVTYMVALTVATPAKGDMSVINNPSSTQSQVAAALLASQESSDLADRSFDDLADIIYQVLMDGLNYDMGMLKGEVADRWVKSIQKNDPLNQGEYVVLTGTIAFSIRCEEQVFGEPLGRPLAVFDSTIDLDGDDTEKTGIIVEV